MDAGKRGLSDVQIAGKVVPLGVLAFDERHLPRPDPPLDRLLRSNGVLRPVERPVPDELRDVVARREAVCFFSFVLADATGQVVCHSHVEDLGSAGHEIRVVSALCYGSIFYWGIILFRRDPSSTLPYIRHPNSDLELA